MAQALFVRSETYPYIPLFAVRVARNVNPPQLRLLLGPEAVGGSEEMSGGEETAGTVMNSIVPQTGQPQTHPNTVTLLTRNQGGNHLENVMFRGCLTIHGNWPSFAREPPMILDVLTVTCPQG